MTRPTREEAARTLGLSVSSARPAVKRAYRRLARQHHPDHGGDPDTFQELHRAYERLVADDPPPGPVVARGRPSRPTPTRDERTEVVDTTAIAWDLTVPRHGRARLDADLVAVWLAAGTDGPGDPAAGPAGDGAGHEVAGPRSAGARPGASDGVGGGAPRSDGAHRSAGRQRSVDGAVVTALTATSRAPGSRLNRVAHLLAAELTARLRVHEHADDRGRPVVGIEVAAGSRRARRALDTVALDGGWVRTRTSSTTRLRASVPPSRDRRATAVRVTRRLEALLEALEWPFTTWTLEQPADAGERTS